MTPVMLPGTVVGTRTIFRGDASQVAAARAWIATTIERFPRISRPAIQDVITCASEIITNGLRYGRSDLPDSELFAVIVSRPYSVRIEVIDPGNRWVMPRVVPMSSPEIGEGGRGLRVVQELSSRWGHQADPVGRSVWFEVTY